jgi:antitoxin component YwqK of YwqJK toxin-antitoxin module
LFEITNVPLVIGLQTAKTVCLFLIGAMFIVACSETNTNGEIVNGYKYFYYSNGRIKAELQVNENGERNGIAKYYSENGTLTGVSNFSNDTLDGEMRTFYPSGNPNNISVYVKGKVQGEVVEYYENGQIKSVGQFVNGIEHGITVGYYESGGKKYEITLDHGIRTGYVDYDVNGNITDRSIVVSVSVPQDAIFEVGRSIPITLAVSYQHVQTDSTKMYIDINGRLDSSVVPIDAKSAQSVYYLKPERAGEYIIRAHASDWANTALGVIFLASDSLQVMVH